MTKNTDKKTSRSTVHPDRWADEFGASLYRYALLRVNAPQVAEDLVQETFLAALNARTRFSGRSSEKTWLVGILKHKIVDYYRKGSHEYSTEEAELINDNVDEFFDRKGRWRARPPAWQVNPSALLEQEEFLTVLRDCLGGLPPRHARAFSLRELDGLDSSEICKLLDITPTNLWVVLHRARLRLKPCMERNWLAHNRVA